MGNKKGKLNQGDSDFIKFFFDLFYRTNRNQTIALKEEDILPQGKNIDVLICGAGSCIHELPVLLKLFESDKYERIKLTFVDKEKEPFKLLNFILKEYGKNKNCGIGKNIIATYFDTTQDDVETDVPYLICENKINYSFHVMDLELDPHEIVNLELDSHEAATTNKNKEFDDFFSGKEFDIVMMSMFLQHISYWRSLIAFLNRHLKEYGHFWFNELRKDDYLLTLDLYMAIIDNKRERKEDWKDFERSIIDCFEKEYYNRAKDQMLFSIISDNYEISPTNTEICRDFFDFFGTNGDVIFEEVFQSEIKPSELFKKAKEKFSPFTKLHSILDDETLSPSFSDNKNDEKLDFTMIWYAYEKVKDEKIKHFDVLDETAKPMKISVLQQYINRTLDILNLNSTIFRPTFLRKDDTSKKMVESAVDLFRRFQLFKIGDFKSIVFFIPDITTVVCLNDTTNNYKEEFANQNEFKERINTYNRAINNFGESNSTLFFDKYKTKMTKPFSIFLEPLDGQNDLCESTIEFKINEHCFSQNQKVHIIKVEGNQTNSQLQTSFVTSLGVSYIHSSLAILYKAFNEHFNISDKYRSILIPCFREPLFDKNKDFLGDLIIFQEDKSDSNNVNRYNESIEFFSWLIRKFIDFTQVATYFDYKRIILQSRKSSKVAIMSRNMSHNLGSHVMFYIKQRLESVGSIFNEGTLEELIRYRSIDELKEKVDELKKQWNDQQYETEMPFLVGLGRFINYLQERQDFIATVATNYIPYSTIINFKDAIYDELKPDLRAERHLGDESLKGRYPDNLLLQYIAKSDGFESSDKIELLFHKFDGRGTPQNVPDELRTFNIALPGGNLGRQAFFSIMENIIRNTAKHDKSKVKDGKIMIQFDRLEEANTIDNILGHSLRRGERKNEKCDNTCYIVNQYRFFYLGITVLLKGEVSDTTIDKIKSGLQQDYLTEDGQMDENCKGLKEIRISAAWMRGEDLDNEISKKEPPAVAIRKNNGHLQYVICLPKPKRVAFITGTNGKLDEAGCREFVLPSKDDKKRQKEIADFEMVVCSKEQRKELVFVGSRILVDDVRECVREYKENGLDKIYKKWLQNEFSKHFNRVKLSILDGKVSESLEINLPTDIEILRGTADDTLPSKYNNNIVFNTHYPGQALSKNKELFAQAHFVESVSGANSTDRLIRHDNRNMAWYCNQMSAGLTDVAIFDERLYKHIVPQEGQGLNSIRKIVEDYLRDNPSATKDDFIFEMASELRLSDDDMCLIGDSLSKDLSLDNCVECLKPFAKRDYSKTWQFREKRIWAFDIQINKDEGVEIIGYNAPPTDGAIGLYNPYKYFETTIGYIKDDNNHFFVDMEPSNGIFLKKFDFISIHQGLLDKVYGELDIHDDYQKEEVTKAIFDCFSKSAGKEIVIDQERRSQDASSEDIRCKYFLPKFIIHSGRSKPNHKDMPQHLPFLQFSAIDHAVRDSKSTLTELFYSAHYEQ